MKNTITAHFLWNKINPESVIFLFSTNLYSWGYTCIKIVLISGNAMHFHNTAAQLIIISCKQNEDNIQYKLLGWMWSWKKIHTKCGSLRNHKETLVLNLLLEKRETKAPFKRGIIGIFHGLSYGKGELIGCYLIVSVATTVGNIILKLCCHSESNLYSFL